MKFTILFEEKTKIFSFQKLRRENRLFRRIEKLEGTHLGILLCLSPLGTLFFASALSLRETPRYATEPGSFPKLSDEPFEKEVSAMSKTKLLFVR